MVDLLRMDFSQKVNVRKRKKPGEITPKEANRVGYETAIRWAKGKYAFFVATHTDRAHIHNHIYYNSTAFDCSRKYHIFSILPMPSGGSLPGYVWKMICPSSSI